MAQPSDASRHDGNREQSSWRGAVERTFLRVRVLRRWYIRRTLTFIDKSRAKGRRLPDGLAETARSLSRVPRGQRARALEDAILANQRTPHTGRQFRRAAARQRRSGKSDTRRRPGLPPGAIKQARRGLSDRRASSLAGSRSLLRSRASNLEHSGVRQLIADIAGVAGVTTAAVDVCRALWPPSSDANQVS